MIEINAPQTKGRRPKIVGHSTNTKKPIQSQFKDMSICVNPLERICQLLLPWTILESCREKNVNEKRSKIESDFATVPVVFGSFKQYVDSLEPLLIEEIKACIISGLDSRAVTSTTCQFSVADIHEKESDLTVLETDFKITDRKENPQIFDLFLISNEPILEDGSFLSEPLYTLSMVVSSNIVSGNRIFQLKTFTKSWKLLQDSCQCNIVHQKTLENTKMTYNMVFTYCDNLRPFWREFEALHQLACNVPLLPEILGINRRMEMASTPPTMSENDFFAQSSNSLSTEQPPSSSTSNLATSTPSLSIDGKPKADIASVGLPAVFVKYVHSSFNEKQIEAISRSVDGQGFTLIQGPPGTGKTSTLIGILNAIHLREYNRYYALALTTVLGPEGWKCRQSPNPSLWLNLAAKLSKLKPHILVTAPSNIAVDNIIQRIIEKGFIDGNGGRYNPNIIRVGCGKGDSVKIVSLEDTLEQEKASYSSSSQRQSTLQSLQERIARVVQEMITLQGFLFNLKTAYDVCNPLPPHFELRVSPENGRPYWVDHLRKTTSLEPPNRLKMEKLEREKEKESTAVLFTFETLPEYLMHSHRMTQLITELESLSLKNARMQAYITGGGSASARQLIESSIIDEAELLFTTLNGSGHMSLENTSFNIVVVDEAAQCVEPSVLIPLRRGCTHCIMVGDQNQLPAIIFSQKVKQFGYDRPLFERLIRAGNPFTLLKTQYRMHPSISEFPSKQFYGGELLDGPNVQSNKYLPVFISPSESLQPSQSSSASSPLPLAVLKPFMFFNLASSRDQMSSQSRINPEESKFCARLIRCLLDEAKRFKLKSPGSIGIITPYSEQQQQLRSDLRRGQDYFSDAALDIEVNTVDGFQGKEKDIIIISTVRGNDFGSIGFLSDPRRMNVALTRAKVGLFVVGHATTLRQGNPLWAKFVEHAEKNRTLIWCEDSNSDILRSIERNGLNSIVTSSSYNSQSTSTVQNSKHIDEKKNGLQLQYATNGVVNQMERLKRRRQTGKNRNESYSSKIQTDIVDIELEDGEIADQDVVEL